MIQTVLFDIDGVLLSEERCFDSSALAVWELLHSPNYLGIHPETFTPTPDEPTIRKIRSDVFCNDEVLKLLKSQGLNSNWDMVFLTFSYQLIHVLSGLDCEALSRAMEILESPLGDGQLRQLSLLLPDDIQLDYGSFAHQLSLVRISKDEIFEVLHPIWRMKMKDTDKERTESFRRLWELSREIFQEWYVGDSFIEMSIGKKARQGGKKGFLQEEIPLAAVEDFNHMFKWMSSQGFRIGIGTGRPAVETFEPFRVMGLLNWVPSECITTSDEVLEAETLFPNQGALGKPHPYTYLQSYFGKEKSAGEVLQYKLPLEEGESILIVGDSVADYYAAQAIGARFAAVLTGLNGRDARGEFEKLGADYILNNVLEIVPLLSGIGQQ